MAAVRAASPRKNGVVSWSSFFGSTPWPWSRTVTITHGPGARERDHDAGDAGVGRAAAVAARVLEQVLQDAAELDVVGEHVGLRRDLRLDSDLRRVAEGRRLARDDAATSTDRA